MHHIVSDGWSMGVFIRELSVLYGAYMRGEEDPLPELGVQYVDYAVWQRELLEVPGDHARPGEQDYSGALATVVLDEELTQGVKELSKRRGTTLYMTLLG